MKLLHLLVLAVALSVSALPALAADTPSAHRARQRRRAQPARLQLPQRGPDRQGVRRVRIALKLDPSHRGAHEYVGVAYLIVKQPDKAREHLATLKTICGENCEEYQDLSKAIAAYKP